MIRVCISLLILLYATFGSGSGDVAIVDIENNVILENQSATSFAEDYFSHNIPWWTNMFTSWQKFQQNVPNLKFLEVGSFEGRSTVWLLNNILTHDSSHITCVDTFEGSYEHSKNLKNVLYYDRFKNNISPYSSKVTVSRGLSSVQLKKISLEVSDKFDFIYIDGDHKAKSVLEDAILSFPLLNVMGIMVFDDYEFEDPYLNENVKTKLGIDAFLQIYEDCYKLFYKQYQVGIQKLKDC